MREVTRVIGCMVSSFPAVKYGKCLYRALKNDKIQVLKASKGNFDAPMCLTASALADLKWWLADVPTSYGFVQPPPISCALSSEATKKGWGGGGRYDGKHCHWGPWQPHEAQEHINVFELCAAYFILKSFLHDLVGKHVKILVDNTCAVSILKNMGTCHINKCNEFAPRSGTWKRK